MNRYKIYLSLLLVALIVLFLLQLVQAGELVSFADLFSFREEKNSTAATVLKHFRLPRAWTSIFAGGSIAVSGLLMQNYFRNPLAGPFVLGVSSGASLGVAFLTLVSTQLILQKWLMVGAALSGGIGVLLAITVLSWRGISNAGLLIVGILISSLIAALITLMQQFSTAEELQLYVFWAFGSVEGLDTNDLSVLGVMCLLGVGTALIMAKRMDQLALGNLSSQMLGVNVKQTRMIILLVAGVLAAGVTAWCGPIAFIGMSVPHAVRLIVRTARHGVLIPLTFLTGAGVLSFCSLLCHWETWELKLPLNALTSLVGTPVVLIILLRQKNRNF